MEWELQPDPVPAQFQEIACFERPMASQHKRHNADIVCGIEFSPDGRFLASAGVTKQVRAYLRTPQDERFLLWLASCHPRRLDVHGVLLGAVMHAQWWYLM
jgi:hypothetical protein